MWVSSHKSVNKRLKQHVPNLPPVINFSFYVPWLYHHLYVLKIPRYNFNLGGLYHEPIIENCAFSFSEAYAKY